MHSEVSWLKKATRAEALLTNVSLCFRRLATPQLLTLKTFSVENQNAVMELSIDAEVSKTIVGGVRTEMSEQERMEGADWEDKCYI